MFYVIAQITVQTSFRGNRANKLECRKQMNFYVGKALSAHSGKFPHLSPDKIPEVHTLSHCVPGQEVNGTYHDS